MSFLRRLARLSTDAGGAAVAHVDVGSTKQIDSLRSSGLIVESQGSLAFALPLLTQWFAAQALVSGEVDLGSLATDPVRLDRWRYAFVMSIGEASFEDSSVI